MLADSGANQSCFNNRLTITLRLIIRTVQWTEFPTCNGKNSLDAFSAYGIVDIAQIFAGILHFGFFDDQSAANLFDTVVQFDWLLGRTAFDVLVPSKKNEEQKYAYATP